jgi:hypothetical protein
MPDNDDLIMKRATEIHEEHRAVFEYGPPPYSTVMDLGHAPTNQRWTLRLSDHLPPSGVEAVVKLIKVSGEAGDPVVLAFGLAYLAAATELGSLMFAMAGEGPDA